MELVRRKSPFGNARGFCSLLVSSSCVSPTSAFHLITNMCIALRMAFFFVIMALRSAVSSLVVAFGMESRECEGKERVSRTPRPHPETPVYCFFMLPWCPCVQFSSPDGRCLSVGSIHGEPKCIWINISERARAGGWDFKRRSRKAQGCVPSATVTRCRYFSRRIWGENHTTVASILVHG